MKRILKSTISFLLIFAILLTGCPEAFLAAEETEYLREVDFLRPEAVTDMAEEDYTKDDTLREPQDYYEEEEPDGTLIAVDEYSKTYQVSDTQFVTQIGGEANVYETEDGELAIVDNTLVEVDPVVEDAYFENKANDYTVKLPVEITEDNGITLEKDGYSIELIPIGGDFSKPAVSDNAVLYNDVFEGIDYQYTIIGDTIKEDIILNKAVERYQFEFKIIAQELNVEAVDGVITLYKDDINNPTYTIIAPEMVDASGNVSTNLQLTLRNEEGAYIATITADSEWLQSAECAYPVRIDPTINITGEGIGLYCVEQGSPDSAIGDNNYPYCGYDDGIVSNNLANYGSAHLISRIYAKVGYDFSEISTEARIDSATFSIYHYTTWSDGATNFGLYQVDQAWDADSLTWNKQKEYSHTFIQYQKANKTEGWITWDVKDVVNSWVQGTATNNGFVIKAENERNMQCEVFHNKVHTNKPILTITWSIPDPVDEDYKLDDITINLRPITEKDVSGKLGFDGVFADGVATPGATIQYWVSGQGATSYTDASLSYKFPDSTEFAKVFPNGTAYKDKVSNWQTQLIYGLEYDTIYKISAIATKDGATSKQVDSDTFLIYKIKQTDTFPDIAKHYGVSLDTIMRDNRVQDNLVVENNTIFIRNPKTAESYNPEELDDDAKKAIDSALMGRGLHCEYGFEPINLNTGNFYFNAVDVSITDLNGEFSIDRTYNSKADGANSMFGRNWSFVYDESLSLCEDGSIMYSVGDGKTLYFTANGDGTYTSPAGYYYTLKRISYVSNGTTYYRYEIHETDGSYKKFNVWGLLTDIVDKDGFTTTIQYNSSYQMKSITSPSGKVYGLTCDSAGRITAISLPNGATLRYTYDGNGNLIEHTDANGNKIKYVYDSKHQMTAWYDQEGNRIILNVYDAEGRVIKQTDANGYVSTLQYKTNQTITTDNNGNVTKYTYDNQYRTTKIEYPNGKVEVKTYDKNNNLVSDYDYTYTYDTKGNKLTETRKDGAVRKYAYNSSNQITQITEFDGTVTKMEYSAAGDMTKITYADGTYESYTYNSAHRITSHTDANGNTEYYSYAGAVLTGYTDCKGNKYVYSYNSMNKRISATAPDGSVTRYMYNAAGVQVGEETADGAYTEYTLNKVGNIIRVTDARGYASDFVYDGLYNLIKGTDPHDNTIIYTYDGNGNKLSETDAEGNTIYYAYDSMNQLVKVTKADGTTTKYTYDIDGNIVKTEYPNGSVQTVVYNTTLAVPTKITDALGYETLYEYNKLGAITKVTYPDGTYIAYEYDSKGRLTKMTDETGLVSEFTYDANGNVLKLVENGVREYSYVYDANNNLIQTTDPLGGIEQYEYDSRNRQTKVTDVNGGVTTYSYDAVGHITKVVDALGNETTYTYDEAGNVTSITKGNGGTTYYNYDAIGNLISEKDVLGNITNYSYNSNQKLTSTTDALGGETTYSYDANGNVVSVTDPLGYTSAITYDSMGNTTKVVLENGDTTEYVYDSLGRVVKSTDAAGLITEYSYDSMGRVTEVSDNAGNTTTYTYDAYGRVISQTDVLGRSETYEYDSFSQVVSVVGVDQNKTTMEYDGLGRLISTTDAEGKTTTFTYDTGGNLIQQTESDGAVYAYTYDLLNRVTSEIDPIGATTSYTYDTEGNLLSVTDGNGITTSYTYDKLNRLTSDTDGNGNVTTYEYDELGRLITLTEPGDITTEYRYDANGNLTKAKDANGYITEYEYDIVGNVTKAISQKGAETLYTYDKHNNLTSVTDALGNVTSYEINLNGMTTKMTQANGGEYTYAYDEVNRVTEITTPNGYSKEFTYDSYGNVIEESDNLGRTTTYEYDIMHRVTKIVDAEGNGTSYTYDSSGNLSTVLEANGATISYVYNLVDQLTSQTDPLGYVTEMKYDLVGNVTSVTEPGERTTTLSYDNNYNLVSITDAMGYTSSQQYDVNDRVVSTTNALGNTTSYEYDALGQATKVTDASGAVVAYEYDAHGNVTKVTNQLGGQTTYSYDLTDNLIKVTDPLARETSYTYDSMGNLLTQTDADGKITTYTYDLEGNMTSLTDENGSTEKMTYDLVGNLVSIVRPDSTTVTYDYDKLNNLVSKTYSEDESEILYLYDTMGNRTSMTDGTGESTYSYDIMGRVTAVTSSDGKTVGYTYDEVGNLSSITYPDGRVVAYTYDLNNRLTKVSNGGEETIYEYDAIGRVTKTLRADGTYSTYSYDVNGNLIELVNMDSDASVLSSFVYTYDEQGYIVKEEAQYEDTTITRTYTYNLSGELTLFTELEGYEYREYAYTYDNSGNRTRLEKTGVDQPETITYEYNSANQLIASTSTISGRTEYTYDANGNLVCEQTDGQGEITYEYTVEQRLSAIREGGVLLMAASYDGDGNRIFQIYRKEANRSISENDPTDGKDVPENPSDVEGFFGFLAAVFGMGDTEKYDYGTVKTYYRREFANPEESIFWYGFGQGFLQFIGTCNAALSAYLSDWFCHAWDYVTAQFGLTLYSESGVYGGYSGADIEAMREAGLTETDIADIIAIGEVSENAQPTEEETGEDETIVLPDSPGDTIQVDYELTYYVNDINTENTEVLMEYGKRGEVKSVYTYGNERISVEDIYEEDYYLYDGRGSVSQVINSDEIVECYTYDPFGNVTSGAPTFDSFYGYNGEDTNPVTGLQYLRARYYDTETGRFSTADTYLGNLIEPLTLNRYTYTVNNPVMHADPSGHRAISSLATSNISALGSAVNKKIAAVASTKSTTRNTSSSPFDKLKETFNKIITVNQNVYDANLAIQQTQASYICSSAAKAMQSIKKFTCGLAERIQAVQEVQQRANQSVQGVLDQYGADVIEKVVLGEYSDKPHTWGSIAVNVGLGLLGADLPSDLRDLAYDLQHLDEVPLWQVAIDGAALLPVIGSIKYVDDAAVVIKNGDELFGAAKYGDDVVEESLDALSKPSSKSLRQNLLDAGDEVPDYKNAAHHIVAGSSAKAEEARAILKKYGVDINDAENGVFLPTQKGVSDAAYHPGLHTNAYYDEVNNLLKEASSKEEVVEILGYIKESLQKGTFMR